MPAQWSERDHDLMDRFLARIYDDVTSGILGRRPFVEHLAYIMTALAKGEDRHAHDLFSQVIKGKLRPAQGSDFES